MPMQLKDEFERAVKIADKDARRAAMMAVAMLEAGLNIDPTSEQGIQFVRETRGILADFADERGFWGDPYKDERQHMYTYALRNLHPDTHKAIGVTAGTPPDYDQAYKTKYLS